MGLDIKKFKDGTLTAKSSISGEVVVKRGSEKDVKRYLMIKAFWKFVDNMIEIDMEFPHRYQVNNKMHIDETKEIFNEWYLENCRKPEFSKKLYLKMQDIITDYDLGKYFNPLVNYETEV